MATLTSAWHWMALIALGLVAQANPVVAQSPSVTVRAVLSAPDSELSYGRAKLTFDALIAPEMDESAVTAEIDQLANAAARISDGGNDIAELQAVRQIIYEAGAWNANRSTWLLLANVLGLFSISGETSLAKADFHHSSSGYRSSGRDRFASSSALSTDRPHRI